MVDLELKIVPLVGPPYYRCAHHHSLGIRKRLLQNRRISWIMRGIEGLKEFPRRMHFYSNLKIHIGKIPLSRRDFYNFQAF